MSQPPASTVVQNTVASLMCTRSLSSCSLSIRAGSVAFSQVMM